MAQQCFFCKKGTQIGGGYSNRTRATQFNPTGKRRRRPNLRWIKTSAGKRIRICTSCLKKNKHLA